MFGNHALSISLVVALFAVLANCQGNTTTTSTTTSTTTTTTLSPMVDESTSTTTTTTIAPYDVTTIDNIAANRMNYDTYGSICCNIQTSCKSCDNIYAVNGITYCCPGCSGIAIVTDLVCRCYPPTGFSFQNINCSLSDKVIGDYIAWRPSYYIAGARSNTFFWSSLFIGVILTRVATLL